MSDSITEMLDMAEQVKQQVLKTIQAETNFDLARVLFMRYATPLEITFEQFKALPAYLVFEGDPVNGNPSGCAYLLKVDDEMAVIKLAYPFQHVWNATAGLGLLNAAMSFARGKDWPSLRTESMDRLGDQWFVYHTAGFEYMPLNRPHPGEGVEYMEKKL